MTKKSIKKIEKLFLDQNGLKQIMNQLLDYTKKLTKNRQNFWLRIDKKSRKKNQKLIFGSELPEDF